MRHARNERQREACNSAKLLLEAFDNLFYKVFSCREGGVDYY